MRRLVVLTVVCIAFLTLENAAAGQESTKMDLTTFGKAMDGHWLGNITLVADIPGIGKAGDEKQVRWSHNLTADGNVIVGRGSDGKGTCNSIYYYDTVEKQIKGVAVFSGGTVVSSVVSKKTDNKWVRRNTAVDPDGTKDKSKDTLVISDGGDTHTWTRDNVSNVWRRARRVTVRGGVELHYVERGKGAPIVFVHAGLSDYSQWNDHLATFAKTYRAIAYSRRYAYPNNNETLPNHSAVVEAEDLAAFIRELDLGKVHVVGYSYGAYTSLFLALKYPDLVRTVTLAEPPVMCWLNDLPEGKSLQDYAMRRCWIPARKAFERNDAIGAFRVFVDYTAGEGAYDNLPEEVRDGHVRNKRSFRALVMSDDRFPAVPRESVRNITVPTLLLYGQDSHDAARLVGKELRKLIPKELQTWVSVPNATHALWHQKPEECRSAVLEFLAGK